jgi:hypothetical protein
MALTKTQKRMLRELGVIAWEGEARAVLTRLEEEFRRWRAEEIDSGALLESIHDFHQHDVRDLFSGTRGGELLVAMRGVALGYIPLDEIPEAIRPLLQEQIDRLHEA